MADRAPICLARSAFVCFSPAPKPCSLQPMQAGACAGSAAGCWRVSYLFYQVHLVIWALAVAYILYGAQPWAVAAFMGVKAAVITIVLQALFKLSQKALTAWPSRLIALGAFLGLFALGAPYPLILALAALAGSLFFATEPEALSELTPAPPLSQSLRTLALGLALWLAPLAALFLSGQSFLTELAAYFAQLALFSFGGAYALLGWMTQTLVQDHGWITSSQMIDALGLAETTPGPLILVTQFTAHLAGHGQGGLGLAAVAGLLTLWMVFTPCFLYIFLGAPYLERLLAMPRLRAALTRDHSRRHRGDRQPLALVRCVCALAKRSFGHP